MNQEGILAIDIGTSSARVSICTKDDGIKDMWKLSHELSARFSADDLWGEVRQLLKEAISSYPDINVRSMAISSFLGWVAVDRNGHPLEKAWSWMAHAGEMYTSQVLDKLPEDTDLIIGRKPSKDLTALVWGPTLKKNPEAILLSYKDYCIYKLTNTFKMDRTHASYTGLLSIQDREWSPVLLSKFGILKRALPQLGNGEDIAGFISESVSRDLGLGGSIPVVLGGPDGTMAVLGCGGVSSGKTVEVMGTTDVFFHLCKRVDQKELYEQGLVQNCYLDAELYGIGGPMGMTGGVLNWFMREWNLSFDDNQGDFQAIMDNWNQIKAAENDLFVIPTFTGARVPDWDPNMRGTIVGLTPQHSKSALYKASVEGIALLTARLRKKIRVFLDIGDEMIATGGGAKNRVLLKTRASASDCVILVPNEVEASTIGAILLAGRASGIFSSLVDGVQELNPIKERIEPDPRGSKIYSKVLKEYEDILCYMNHWYNRK